MGKKLAETGFIHLEDCEAWVADRTLYPDEKAFIEALTEHSEFSPEYFGYSTEELVPFVDTSYMMHRVASLDYKGPCWIQVEEPGRGHSPVWYIDMEEVWDFPRTIIQEMKGEKHGRY